MFNVDAVVGLLALEQVGADTYRARNVDSPGPVVYGGQLLAQSIAAGLIGQEGKAVKTLHTVFARAGRPDQPLDVAVTRLSAGRTMASNSVTISQNGKVVAQSTVLLSVDEPDFIRHTDSRPALEPPKPGEPLSGGHGRPDSPGDWEASIVGAVDLDDSDANGPAELDVWTRWPGAPADRATGQALVAFVTDGFLIGAAMRPHPGVSQAQSHRTVSTSVLSHTITFHEPVNAGDWLLLSTRVPYTGHGRAYGRGDIFAVDGSLVASYVQDSMIRAMAPSADGGHRL